MSTDASAAAAAFFASKKKKTKNKKFNANKISIGGSSAPTSAGTKKAASVAAVGKEHAAFSSNHVDAPKLSRPTTGLDDLLGGPDDGWAEPAAGPQSSAPKTSAVAGVLPKKKPKAVGELLDMSALNARRAVEDDIVERLRIEETRGMLRGAAAAQKKLEEDEAERKEGKAPKAAPRALGAPVAAPAAPADGKWIPAHMRNRSAAGPERAPGQAMGLGAAMGRMRMSSKKVDTGDGAAFPTLSQGVAAVAAEEEAAKKLSAKGVARPQQPSRGGLGGASWGAAARKRREEEERGTRKPLSAAQGASRPAQPVAPVKKDKVEVYTVPVREPKPIPVPAPAPVAAAAVLAPAPVAEAAPVERKKKKKKKDLSTFKPGG